MSNVKLFISYKEKHKIIKSDIITPIQTGRAIADEIFEGMIGDDTGDNISKDNKRYCELSAQYWVWKNYEQIGNPEYVGFMHYRRHFIFDKNFKVLGKQRWLPGIDMFVVDSFNEECQKNLASKNIYAVVDENYECYVIKPYNVRLLMNNNVYMKEHFISTILGSKRYIYNEFYNVVAELYPNYRKYLDAFTFGSNMNCCNMFIMTRKLFFEYSQFCFDVLKELDSRIDSSEFNSQEQRFLGFLAEYLLTIFVLKLEEERRKIKYLDACFINNSLKNKPIENVFSIKNTPRHKVITLLGLQIKIRRDKLKSKEDKIIELLWAQSDCIRRLENKVTELQEELIVNKGK